MPRSSADLAREEKWERNRTIVGGVVILILIGLAAVYGPGFFRKGVRATHQKQIDKDIARIEEAVGKYHRDVGEYPTHVMDLMLMPITKPQWEGPYLAPPPAPPIEGEYVIDPQTGKVSFMEAPAAEEGAEAEE